MAETGDLRLSTQTLIIIENDALHIITRQGIKTICAKNIGHLHGALLPHLRRGCKRSALLTLVPQRLQRVTDNYLRELLNTQALISVDAGQEDAGASKHVTNTIEPTPTRTVSSSRSGAGLISLAGPVREKATQGVQHLCFISNKQLANELLKVGKRRHDMIFVAASDDPASSRLSADEQTRRSIHAQWLLSAHESTDTPRSRFYRWSEGTGCLHKFLDIRSTDKDDIRSIPDKLNLITMVNARQRPLICLQLGSVYYPQQVSRFAVRFSTLREELVRECIAEALLQSGRNLSLMRFCTSALGQTTREIVTERTSSTPRWNVAPSFLALRAQALESSERREYQEGDHSETVDVLGLKSSHHDIAYLQSVLRLRRRSIGVFCGKTVAGYFFFGSPRLFALSLIREKALRDILLQLAWDEYYHLGETFEAAMGCDFTSFLDAPTLEREVVAREVRRSQAGHWNLLYCCVNAWGRNVWIGRGDLL